MLAIVLVPVWLAVLGPLCPRLPPLAPERAAMVLAESFFLPLLLGMAIRWLFPKAAAWTAGRLVGLAGIVLAVSALALLAVHGYVVLEARWTGILTLAALIALSLAIGHLVGGPEEDTRTALAIACATRHIGIAVLVATSVPGPRTAVVVAIYIAVSLAISLPYLSSRPVRPSRRRPAVRRRRRRRGRAGRRQRPSPPRRSGG